MHGFTMFLPAPEIMYFASIADSQNLLPLMLAHNVSIQVLLALVPPAAVGKEEMLRGPACASPRCAAPHPAQRICRPQRTPAEELRNFYEERACCSHAHVILWPMVSGSMLRGMRMITHF